MVLSDLRCVGSFDTEAYDVNASAVAQDNSGVLYRNAFGRDPMVWTEASPLTHVRGGQGIPSFFLVTRGSMERTALSMRFVSSLQAAGSAAELVLAPQYDHEGVNDAIGRPGETVITPAFGAFLERCAQ